MFGKCTNNKYRVRMKLVTTKPAWPADINSFGGVCVMQKLFVALKLVLIIISVNEWQFMFLVVLLRRNSWRKIKNSLFICYTNRLFYM